MITTEREKSHELRRLEALRRRVPKDNPSYEKIEEKWRIKMSGFKGEKSLDYYIKFFPKKNYHILNGIRLLDSLTNTFFEIDSLIISSTYLLDMDAKNHKGELIFDHHFDQMHQIFNDKKITYTCPLTQMYRHRVQLIHLLESYRFPIPPIEALVVVTNPSTTISALPNHPGTHKIIHSPSLIMKKDLFEKMYKKEVLDKKQILKLTKLLKKLHTPFDKNILLQFGIDESTLLKGVQCPQCGGIPMKRIKGNWHCISCDHSSKTAHLEALTDYALLINTKITNKEVREFLLLPSETAAKYILQSLKLQYTGNTKGREYILPLQWVEK